jgi:transcriptional regulator with PAS, ATPase and Fis domain
MEEITGYKLEEARGEKMCDIFGAQTPFEECGSPTELVDRTMRVETRTKDGRQRPLEISFRAIGSRSDEIMGVVSDLFRFYDEIRAVENAFSFHGMISGSPSMREVFRQIDMAAGSDINVLVCGESGTGKELVARAIHNLSARRNRPFYAVNCATFTGGLLLSELFGHERGAFTGAVRTRPGKLEMAGDGTLFLDEVSEIPLQHQSLLLRVLEQRLFERVGGQSSIEMNARIIAATNRDLNTAVSEGRFREDLHYRLKVFPIRVPPLRERPEDIEILANYFLKRTAVARNDRLKALSPETLADLAAYPWPGNVRELRNMIEYLYFVSEEEILPKNLPSDFRKALNRGTAAPNEDEPLVDVGAAGEKTRIAEAMEKARYKRKVAAEMLGMDRTTLWRKLRKYGLEE